MVSRRAEGQREAAGETGSAQDPRLSFEGFYRVRWAPMVRLAALIVSRVDVAEELVQDAFVRTAGSYAQVAHPNAYLRAAVVNACRNHMRRQRLERRHAQPLPAPATNPELDETWEQLARLTPRRRMAVVLRYYEDLTVDEVASALGCRRGTAASLIHRGLADLKGVLS